MNTFFLGPWLLVCQFIEISNQMELNGEVWTFGYYNKSDFHCNSQSFRLRHLAPFDWKFLQIGTLRAKDLRKNVPILQKWGFIPAPLTLLAIRVVLLHKLIGVLNPLIPQLYVKCKEISNKWNRFYLNCSFDKWLKMEWKKQ